MKITKLLTIILAVPILAGCGTNSLRNAQFSNYSNEVTFADFLNNISKEEFFYSKDNKLSTVSVKAFLDSYEENSTNRKGENIKTITYYRNSDSEGGYNSINNVANLKQKIVSTQTTKDAHKVVNDTRESEDNYLIQESKINDANNVVIINENTKTYQSKGLVTEDFNVAKCAINYASYYIASGPLYSNWSGYESYSQEEQNRYSFYKDNNIYTFIYSGEYDVEKFQKNSAGEAEIKAHFKVEEKLQYVFNDSSFYRSWMCNQTVTLTALKNTTYGGIYDLDKDDTLVQKINCTYRLSVESSEYNKEAVDLSDYTLNN